MSLNEQDCRRPYERDDDYRVMRFKVWCDSKGLSVPTGRRLVRSGKGPRIVQLSARTIGVTVKDDREWTEARIRTAQSDTGQGDDA
jgi:hypothetical protein